MINKLHEDIGLNGDAKFHESSNDMNNSERIGISVDNEINTKNVKSN